LSDGHFPLLERQPDLKDRFRLGNHRLWVTRSDITLVIDTGDSKEKMTDSVIDRFFAR